MDKRLREYDYLENLQRPYKSHDGYREREIFNINLYANIAFSRYNFLIEEHKKYKKFLNKKETEIVAEGSYYNNDIKILVKEKYSENEKKTLFLYYPNFNLEIKMINNYQIIKLKQESIYFKKFSKFLYSNFNRDIYKCKTKYENGIKNLLIDKNLLLDTIVSFDKNGNLSFFQSVKPFKTILYIESLKKCFQFPSYLLSFFSRDVNEMNCEINNFKEITNTPFLQYIIENHLVDFQMTEELIFSVLSKIKVYIEDKDNEMTNIFDFGQIYNE